jgi:hypothetical protein
MTLSKAIKSRDLPKSLNIWLLNLFPCPGDLEAFRLCRTQIYLANPLPTKLLKEHRPSIWPPRPPLVN